MRVMVVNGASGVGKTTLLSKLTSRLPQYSGILDGDHMGRLYPYECTVQWLDLVQDNLLACAQNMASIGIKLLIIAFIFPCQERMDRLNRIFRKDGHELTWIHLVADERSITIRLRERQVRREDIIKNSIQFNSQIQQLAESNQMLCIDTSNLSVEELCDKIMEMV